MWICKKCNSMNADEQSKFCPKCGEPRKGDDSIQLSAVLQSRQNWQYKVITVDCGVGISTGSNRDITRQSLELALTMEGSDGWELVSVTLVPGTLNYLAATFKRPS